MTKQTKKSVIISVVVLFIFIVAMLSVSFAYYTSGTDRTGDGNSSIGTAKLSATFTDGDIIQKTIVPGDTFTKTFALENNSTVPMKYKIVVKDLVNEFISFEDITYVLTDDAGYKKEGIFPKSTQALSDEITLGTNSTRNYTLTITYQNTAVDQSPDMGKTISGKIFIEEI